MLLVAGLLVGARAARGWWDLRSDDHAARLLDRRHYGRAARQLWQKLVLTPGDPLAHYYLGRAYAGLGLSAAARSQFAEAVRLAPQKPVFHAALGCAYRDAGHAALAMRELDEAIRRDPTNPRYHVDLAGLLLDQGHVWEAVDHLRRAVQLEPGAADRHLLLADELAQLGDRAEATREYGNVVCLAGPGSSRRRHPRRRGRAVPGRP